MIELNKEQKELVLRELKFALNLKEKRAARDEMALREDYVSPIKGLIKMFEEDLR